MTSTSYPSFVSISSGEYYWGEEDPGEGAGTAMLSFDGDFSSAVETVFSDISFIKQINGIKNYKQIRLSNLYNK